MFRKLTIPCSPFAIYCEAGKDSRAFMEVYFHMFEYIMGESKIGEVSFWNVDGNRLDNTKTYHAYALEHKEVSGKFVVTWLFDGEYTAYFLSEETTALLSEALDPGGTVQ